MVAEDGAISVIIPTHNRVEKLVRALDSVIRQSRPATEIIVIDDGSTDTTRDRVARFARSSPTEITYLRQPNRGPAAARNAGIVRARGAFLAFLDSDDEWRSTKLEMQAAAMGAEPSMAISHTRETWFRRGVHLNQKAKHRPPHGYIFEHCLPLCCVGMSTVMVRRGFFSDHGYFNAAMRCCEDYEMWLRSAHAEDFLLVDAPLTIKHGGREDQVSYRFRTGMDRYRIQALGSILRTSPLDGIQRAAAAREMHRKCTIYGSGCLKHNKAVEGAFYVQLGTWAKRMSGSADERGRYGLD